ncbi:MAG: hypothetical protein ACK5IC_02255 [Moheibacter sp.]
MNKSEVKKLVEYFEDKVLTNFDTHFSWLVLEDFYGGGYKDRIEDEFFYDEYFEQYEESIINLLLHIEDEMDSDYMDFKIRLIKLKRLIDNHLIKIGKSPTHIKPIRQSRITYFHLKDKIDRTKFITLLYDELTSKNFIDCSFEIFEQLFSETPNRIKVQWKGTEKEITYLINGILWCFDDGVGKTHFKLIEILFINRFGSPFKNDQLNSFYYGKSDEILPKDSIYKVVNKIDTDLSLT